jgi:cell division protein FtsN
MSRKVSMSIVTIIAFIVAATVVVTLTQFVNIGVAQAQVNSTSSPLLTPQQKAAICDPNNPSSNLNPVNTTESKLCGIPVTVKPHLSNMTTSNMTTGAPAGTLSSSTTPSAGG